MMARHLPENIGESDESAAYESDASTNADSDVDSFSYDVAYIQIRVPIESRPYDVAYIHVPREADESAEAMRLMNLRIKLWQDKADESVAG